MEPNLDQRPPPTDRWAEASLTVGRERQEAVTDALFTLGALGVTELVEDPCFDVGDGRQVRPAADPRVTLKALFDDEDLDVLRDRVMAGLGAILDEETRRTVATSVLEDRDWNEKWKEGFHPIEIGPRLALCPTWETYTPRPGQVVVTLDPGMAFGTGSHETTRSCLRLIERLLTEEGAGQPDLLDVGTGSGVLAIAALSLGARWAWGLDLDPLAVEAARANAHLNGVEERLRADDTPVEEVVVTFPLVVANILSGPLVELASAIGGRVEVGGRLILSGLLREQAEEVLDAYVVLGLTPLEQHDDGDWTTLLLGRPR